MAFELIKVSELPELTTPADANVLPIQDGDYLKRISFANLKDAAVGGVEGSLAAAYDSTATYAVGDYCIYEGQLYRCTTAIATAEAWTAGHWTVAVLTDDLAAEVTAREGAVSGEATARGNADAAILADLASPYSASSTYAVGDYCTKDGQLYRCTTAISTAEAWTAAHWSAVALGDDTRDLRSALNALNSDVTQIEGRIIQTETKAGSHWRDVKINSAGAYGATNDFYDYIYDVTNISEVAITTKMPANGRPTADATVAFYSVNTSNMPSPPGDTSLCLGTYGIRDIGAIASVVNLQIKVPTGAKSMVVCFDAAYVSNIATDLVVQSVTDFVQEALSYGADIDKIEGDLYEPVYQTAIPTTANSAINTTSIGVNDQNSIHANIPEGTTCVMRMDTDLVDKVAFYALYDGGTEYINISNNLLPYTDFTFIAAHDIVAIGFYRAKAGVLKTGTLTIKCKLPNTSYIVNPLKGKKIMMFGDSITQLPYSGASTGNGIVEWFAKLTGATVIRAGIGGTHLARTEVPTTITDADSANAALEICSMVEAMVQGDLTLQTSAAQYLADHGGVDSYVQNTLLPYLATVPIASMDIVTIFGGTNDCGAGFPLDNGTDDTLDTSCVRGAINYIIKTICTAYPHIKVFVFTPIIRQFVEGNDSTWSDIYAPHGTLLPQYVEEIESASKFNHIPVCDLYWGMGWNKYNFATFCTTTDMTHPRKGFRELAEKMISFIQAHL